MLPPAPPAIKNPGGFVPNGYEEYRQIHGRYFLPVIIDNDANMYALAELLHGAAKGRKNLIVLTLGSGIGGGIVIDGKVFHGDRGFAGEVGHIVVEPDGVPCMCGGRGCFEEYAASRAFVNIVRGVPSM